MIALDLAKKVIQVCKISKHGELVFNKAMSRNKLKMLLANHEPAVVAMEGCSGFHFWGQYAQQFGHEVRGMAPAKVKPYVSNQKTDKNDALGIATAAIQINMNFCPVKTIEQQNIQALNTSRKMLERLITKIGNHIRALAFEYGEVMSQGKKALRERVAQLTEDESTLPIVVKNLLNTLWLQYKQTQEQFDLLDKQIKSLAKQLEPCTRLMKLEGVGEIGAVGLFNVIGDGCGFKNGRDASVYIGATPKQQSSGGKVVMVGIDKFAGEKELRAVLYQGALSVISRLPAEPITLKQHWLINLVRRAGIKRACIALVNKTIRTAWALLRNKTEYEAILVAA